MRATKFGELWSAIRSAAITSQRRVAVSIARPFGTAAYPTAGAADKYGDKMFGEESGSTSQTCRSR